MNFFLFSIVLALSGCQTEFFGPAKVKGGARGCKAKCGNLEFVGMVYFGEYSDGCVCRVKDQDLSLLETSSQTGGPLATYWKQKEDRKTRQLHTPSASNTHNPSEIRTWSPGLHFGPHGRL